MPSPQPADSVLYSVINSFSKDDDDSVFVPVFVPFLFFFPFLFSFFFFCVVVVVFSSLSLSSSDLFVLAKSFERALGTTALLKPSSLPQLLVRPFESILDDKDDGDASGSRIALFGILLASSRHPSRRLRRRRRLKDDDDDDDDDDGGVVVVVVVIIAVGAL